LSWIPIKKSIDFYTLTLLLNRQPRYGSVNLMTAYRHRFAQIMSASIVSLFVMGSFLGIIAATPSAAAAPGDLTINGPFTIGGLPEKTIYYVDGNVKIQAAGTLTISNAELRITSDVSNQHWLNVSGGKLIMIGGTITTYLNATHPWPLLTMVVENGGSVTMTEDSILAFPGWLEVNGSSSKITMTDSNITCLPSTDGFDSGVGLLLDDVNDGPAITVTNGTVEMFDSFIFDSPEGTNRADITLAGRANLTAVNSFIDVDFLNTTDNPTTYNELVLSNDANAYLYGCTFDGVLTPPGDSAIKCASYSANSVPTHQVFAWDNSGELLTDLYQEDGTFVYNLIAGERMAVDLFNLTPIQSSTYHILSVNLLLKFTASSDYNGTRPINYTLGGTTKSTGITPVANDIRRIEVDMYSKGVDTKTEINSLIVSFNHTGSTGNVQFDLLCLEVVVGPRVYIYRWGDISVSDQYGIPLSGANISAKFNSSTWLGNVPVSYYTPKGSWVNPWNTVLTYLGKTNATYRLTNSEGNALIPYLTDIVDASTSPNSLAVGSLNVTATYTPYSKYVDARFDPYPSMSAENKMLSASVSITGATAPTWDSSKYLVVPPNKLLTGAFTHNGDIIVKPTGNLTLQDIDFAVQRDAGETAKATVYSGGALWIIRANFTSDQPLELEVKSGGKLVIANSVIGNTVSITVHGSATVQMAGSEIQGQLTFASDATLTTEIKNTSFTNAPIFGGTSTVNLTGVSAPSIAQEDSSKVNLYRYVTVMVNDMTDKALEGALVKARFQLESVSTIRASGTSNSSGMVSLKLLTCRMNASGGSVTTNYFGNYKFNTTYSLPPTKNATEKSISLISYTEPLEVIDVSVTMTVPVAFSDLTFGINGIYTDPSPPTDGTATIVYAQIDNIGGADIPSTDPFNVSFYYDVVDQAHLIGNYTMAGLASGGSDTAQVTWGNPPAGIKTIFVRINPLHIVIERNYGNNDANLSLEVLKKADIDISSMFMYYSNTQIPSGGEIPSDRTVLLYVFVRNTGNTSVTSQVTVMLYNDTISVANRIAHANISQPMSKTDTPIQVVFTLVLPPINESYVDRTYWVMVNPINDSIEGGYFAPIPEVSRADNLESYDLRILDSRPDPMITASSIALYLGNDELSTKGNNISYASDLRVVVTVVNDGINGVDQVSVSLDINGTGALIGETAIGGNVKYVDLNGSGAIGSSIAVEWTYKVTVKWAGAYRVNITLDKEGLILNDKNASNNNAWHLINVTYIKPVISLFANFPATNVTSGNLITISGEVRFPVTNYPMAGVPVAIQVQNGIGTSIGVPTTATANTTSGGIFSVQVSIPSDTPSGQYKIVVTVSQTTEEVKTINISAPGTIMDYLFIIIIIAIVAAALVFTYFIYRQGVGKLVECGECGSLIPESAKKCPKCGVEFEENMVKCSECGAWIASDSLECPNCHVRFGTPLEGEKSYEEQMMDQYDHMVLAKYREVAKGELGKSYTEETFQNWWAGNPAYISFEDWLVKEEERRKQANLVTCSVCGTPNPPGSTTCNNCGSPLEGGKGESGGGGAGGASTVVIEKRVIRQPVDRRVVPKKVVRKPLDEQQQGGQR